MTFRDYYQQLKKKEKPIPPAKAFIIRISEITGRSPKTIYQWISGIQQPPSNVCMLIGEELGIPPEDLFP